MIAPYPIHGPACTLMTQFPKYVAVSISFTGLIAMISTPNKEITKAVPQLMINALITFDKIRLLVVTGNVNIKYPSS